MTFFCEDFNQYLQENISRCDFIQNWLLKHGIESQKLIIENKSHILVQFNKSHYNSNYKIKTIISHYDRFPFSPGANDNSAANWILMNWCVRLKELKSFHNIRIIFTDGEELGFQEGVKEQGAYGIASIFKRLGFVNDDIIVFDACGCGNIPILSDTKIASKASLDFSFNYKDLFNRIEKLLFSVFQNNWDKIPTSYSDNAAFISLGIPAVVITLLPFEELLLYKNSSYENIPRTWKNFHTKFDSIENLNDVSILVMEKILFALENLKTNAVRK